MHHVSAFFPLPSPNPGPGISSRVHHFCSQHQPLVPTPERQRQRLRAAKSIPGPTQARLQCGRVLKPIASSSTRCHTVQMYRPSMNAADRSNHDKTKLANTTDADSGQLDDPTWTPLAPFTELLCHGLPDGLKLSSGAVPQYTDETAFAVHTNCNTLELKGAPQALAQRQSRRPPNQKQKASPRLRPAAHAMARACFQYTPPNTTSEFNAV